VEQVRIHRGELVYEWRKTMNAMNMIAMNNFNLLVLLVVLVLVVLVGLVVVVVENKIESCCERMNPLHAV